MVIAMTRSKTVIFERVNDVVYQRESGAKERTEVTRNFDLYAQLQEDKLWGKIRRKAKTHPGLQAELDRVIMFYNLLDKE
jgi:hypothetical protein